MTEEDPGIWWTRKGGWQRISSLSVLVGNSLDFQLLWYRVTSVDCVLVIEMKNGFTPSWLLSEQNEGALGLFLLWNTLVYCTGKL